MKSITNLSNTVIVITGAASGIGRATALEAAGRGARLVLAARREDALNELAAECAHLGGECLAVPIDVSLEDDVKHRLFQQALERFGRIDVWINNAAVTLLGPFEETPVRDIKRLFDINILGYVYGAQAVIPHFKANRKGTLINVSSMVSITGQPYSSAYNMSKFAIRGLSYSLEQELSGLKDVHVCTVLPAVIDTPLFNQAANYMGKAIRPMKPVIPAQRVAEAILKLVHEPQKEVMVGNLGRLAAAVRSIAPGWFDRKFLDKVQHEHFEDRSVPLSTGNLYQPMPQWAKVSGGWTKEGGANGTAKTLAVAAAAVTGFMVGGYYLRNHKKRIVSGALRKLV